MFLTNRKVPVYDKPSLSGTYLGETAATQELSIKDTPVVADGWVWHELTDGNLWVQERKTDNSAIFMVWQGAGSAPTPAEETSTAATPKGAAFATAPEQQYPAQPDSFTNQQLITAFSNSANALGVAELATQWLNDAGIASIGGDPSAIYTGTPIAELSNLDDEIKLVLLARLKEIVEGADDDATVEVMTEPEVPESQGRFKVNGTQFLLDGTPFRFVGVNVREIAYYGYSGWNDGRYTNPSHIDLQLDTAREMRAQVIRLYAPYNLLSNGQPGTSNQEAIDRIGNILEKCQQRNMFVLVSLDDGKQSGFNIAVDNAAYREPGFRLNAAYHAGGYKKTFYDFIDNVVGGLAGHSALFAWGVCNETQVNPFDASNPPDMLQISESFMNYYRDITQRIRTADPSTLITTSIESCHHLFVEHAYSGRTYANKLYTLPTIDFATVHSYRDYRRMDNVIGHGDERVRQEMQLAKDVWNKPLVMEEIGPVGGEHRPDGGVWIGNALQELFNIGLAGAMQWGFQATDGDIGVGDADAGMHRGGNGIPSGDWQSLFDTYKKWGDQFWV